MDGKEIREEFMGTVYTELEDDETNDRANRIIDAFDAAMEAATARDRKAKPKMAMIFEGEKGERLMAEGKNFWTWKCPVCNWIVRDQRWSKEKGEVTERVTPYCQNCGQALDTSVTD